MIRRLALAVAAFLALLPAAAAESLTAATSTGVVSIGSNFTGTTVTVFGTIERDRATVSRAAPYEIAVQLIGPRETVVTRRKERRFGIWMNRDSRTYLDVPSLYTVMTTGPLSRIATAEALKRHQVGLDSMLLPERFAGGSDLHGGDGEFRAAFLRLKKNAGLYREIPGGVDFLTPTLFRAVVPIPANVPVGRYTVQVLLFQETLPLAEHTSDLVVSKTGFEQFTYALAFEQPLVYGLATVLLALFTGWLGGVLFRRD